MAMPSPSTRPLGAELASLRELLASMSELVEAQVADAIHSMSANDLDLARQVRERDDEVDRLELEVDEHSERILALFTPVAVDLRLIIAAVKVNTDLERIGDHAKNIAKHVCQADFPTMPATGANLRAMADEARWMLRSAHEAFFRKDQVLAREIVARDQRVDRMYKEMLDALSNTGPDHVDKIVHLVHMGKSIERIADHAKSIGKIAVFLVEGVDIRHRSVARNAPETA